MRFFYFVIAFILIFSEASAGRDKRPKITGQKPLSVQQGNSITIKLSDLIVETDDDDDDDDDHDEDEDDKDKGKDDRGNGSSGNDDYPKGYYVVIYPGDHYTYSGATITPDPAFTGTLKADIRVSNGKIHSKKFRLQVSVLPKEDEPDNTPPVITGQQPLNVNAGAPITVKLSHLTVTDPDDNYPSGFTLTLFPGADYTHQNHTVTPSGSFSGILTVSVKVNDGEDSSPAFPLKITVEKSRPDNVAPVITGQLPLTTGENETIAITLSHLEVTDPDDNYPAGFSLSLSAGANYSFSQNKVTPATAFSGTLTVPVRVNDGKNSSAPFNLKIDVEEKGKVEITGHRPLSMPEDSTLAVRLSDLIVTDPQKRYPKDFRVIIHEGSNYSVDNGLIRPDANFNGRLAVPVQVRDERETSDPVQVTIDVTPVNDAPGIDLDSASLKFRQDELTSIAAEAKVTDIDDHQLLQAEIRFDPDHYQKGHDELFFQPAGKVAGAFDRETGALILVGLSSLEDYENALRSIQYNFATRGDTLPSVGKKVISFRVSDGKDFSATYHKAIVMMENIDLEIPTAFTPNNDNANDTWVISPVNDSDSYDDALIRIYNRRGILIHEVTGLENSWDGRLQGNLLPADTYYYTIEFNTAFKKTRYKGIVTILH